jgi:hypothetical protein
MGAKPMASKVFKAMGKLHGLFLCEKTGNENEHKFKEQ